MGEESQLAAGTVENIQSMNQREYAKMSCVADFGRYTWLSITKCLIATIIHHYIVDGDGARPICREAPVVPNAG
jgi:hypothetical protein